MENILVPMQEQGSLMDADSKTVIDTSIEAEVFYEKVKHRLMNVNQWHHVCGTSATQFQLTLPNGTTTDNLDVGHLIRIDIPGPGTSAGDGYDWVRIEQIEESDDSSIEKWMGFRVRPCPSPTHPEMGVAHFFSDRATSTFMVSKRGQEIWAEVHGRNELANGDSEKIFDGLRNAMVGWTARIGLSFPQWKLLVEGLVKKEN